MGVYHVDQFLIVVLLSFFHYFLQLGFLRVFLLKILDFFFCFSLSLNRGIVEGVKEIEKGPVFRDVELIEENFAIGTLSGGPDCGKAILADSVLIGADDHGAVVGLIELILADLACQICHHS